LRHIDLKPDQITILTADDRGSDGVIGASLVDQTQIRGLEAGYQGGQRVALRVLALPQRPHEGRPSGGRGARTQRLDQLELAQPTVVFVAKDGDGRDVAAVKVTMAAPALEVTLTGCRVNTGVLFTGVTVSWAALLFTEAPPVPAPTEPPAVMPTPAPPPPAVTEPAVTEPPPPRIVQREGLVRGMTSIQAPSKFVLVSPENGRDLDYLFTTSKELDLRRYKGMRIIVTGEEGLDER